VRKIIFLNFNGGVNSTRFPVAPVNCSPPRQLTIGWAMIRNMTAEKFRCALGGFEKAGGDGQQEDQEKENDLVLMRLPYRLKTDLAKPKLITLLRMSCRYSLESYIRLNS